MIYILLVACICNITCLSFSRITRLNGDIVAPLRIYNKYFDLVDGFGADYRREERKDPNGIVRSCIGPLGTAGVYGEVYGSSIRDAMTSCGINLNERDVFYDLGAGTGRVVAQIAYETACGQSIGVELGERRYQLSLKVLERLQGDQNSFAHKKMHYVKSDLTRFDWQSSVTCLYSCCLCFPDEVFQYIENEILNSCPHLKYVLLVGKQLQNAEDLFTHHQVTCRTSWNENEICEVYIRKI